MAIKIIKKPTTLFTMECEKCECVFSYGIHDINNNGYNDYVECPYCKTHCVHCNRKKKYIGEDTNVPTNTEGGGMKVLYRPQRSTLDDAMAEVKEFASLKEMCAYLVSEHERAFDISDVYISYYCYDERIEWETYIVTVARYYEEDYLKEYHSPQAIGFCTFIERSENDNT